MSSDPQVNLAASPPIDLAAELPGCTPEERSLALWSLTAYPFSDREHTLRQLREVAAKLARGVSLDQQVGETEAEMSRILRDYEDHGEDP